MKDFKINIGKHKWDIKFVDYIKVEKDNALNITNAPILKEDNNVCGVCDYDNKVIAVIDDDEVNTTLAHEIIHAVSYEYNMNITENNTEEIAKAIINVGFKIF